tara:strand:+ start:295 stop:1068 length:774 start_codon:yes stop_codon:yes gene_type:complete
MATNHNFANNRVGGEGIGSKAGQGIYAESSTAKYAIGEKLELADGRVFRYASFAAATGAGILVSQDISATAVVETDGVIVASSGDYSLSAGSSMVEITLGAATENQFQGGYLHITDDEGEGYQYRIKSNTARGDTSSGNVGFTLFDPLVVTLDASNTDIAITGNLYNQVRAALGTADYIVSGVTPRSFTSGYYGWVQTRGIATILTDDSAIGIGVPVMCGDAQAGAVEVADNSHPLVGFVTHAADDTGYMGVALQLP